MSHHGHHGQHHHHHHYSFGGPVAADPAYPARNQVQLDLLPVKWATVAGEAKHVEIEVDGKTLAIDAGILRRTAYRTLRNKAGTQDYWYSSQRPMLKKLPQMANSQNWLSAFNVKSREISAALAPLRMGGWELMPGKQQKNMNESALLLWYMLAVASESDAIWYFVFPCGTTEETSTAFALEGLCSRKLSDMKQGKLTRVCAQTHGGCTRKCSGSGV